jgi:uncharacterized OsmC-like protein
MEVTIGHKENVRFEADARGHRLICDQPAENGGTDQGMTPPEFLLTALGTCAAYYAVQYLKARSLPSEALQVRVSAEKETQPARMERFRIEITLPGLDARHETGLHRAVEHCLIKNTLLHAPSIETVVHTTAAA